jgi:hypothetical protein
MARIQTNLPPLARVSALARVDVLEAKGLQSGDLRGAAVFGQHTAVPLSRFQEDTFMHREHAERSF